MRRQVVGLGKNCTEENGKQRGTGMRIGIAADHGGFALKRLIAAAICERDGDVVDFGAHELNPDDDYPDFVLPLARAVARKEIARGIAVCGSGVSACVAANKVPGVRPPDSSATPFN
jgi:ribose 5-phosphate isomerase B